MALFLFFFAGWPSLSVSLDGAVDESAAGPREERLGELVGLVVRVDGGLVVAVAEVPHRCQAFGAIAARKWGWHCSASILSSDTAESLWQSLRASSVTHRNALISDFRLYICHTKVGVSGTLGSTRVLPNVPPPGPPTGPRSRTWRPRAHPPSATATSSRPSASRTVTRWRTGLSSRCSSE